MTCRPVSIKRFTDIIMLKADPPAQPTAPASVARGLQSGKAKQILARIVATQTARRSNVFRWIHDPGCSPGKNPSFASGRSYFTRWLARAVRSYCARALGVPQGPPL
jgi:hypothetical protein